MSDKSASESTVAVPAALLTRACQLIGKLPAEHAAHVYVELLACKPVEESKT